MPVNQVDGMEALRLAGEIKDGGWRLYQFEPNSRNLILKALFVEPETPARGGDTSGEPRTGTPGEAQPIIPAYLDTGPPLVTAAVLVFLNTSFIRSGFYPGTPTWKVLSEVPSEIQVSPPFPNEPGTPAPLILKDDTGETVVICAGVKLFFGEGLQVQDEEDEIETTQSKAEARALRMSMPGQSLVDGEPRPAPELNLRANPERLNGCTLELRGLEFSTCRCFFRAIDRLGNQIEWLRFLHVFRLNCPTRMHEVRARMLGIDDDMVWNAMQAEHGRVEPMKEIFLEYPEVGYYIILECREGNFYMQAPHMLVCRNEDIRLRCRMDVYPDAPLWKGGPRPSEL